MPSRTGPVTPSVNTRKLRRAFVVIKMTSWLDAETFILLDLWGDEAVQALLDGCTRNCHVYERISGYVQKGGYKGTWSQRRDKLKMLRKEYKKLKDYHEETGRKRKKWRFFL